MPLGSLVRLPKNSRPCLHIKIVICDRMHLNHGVPSFRMLLLHRKLCIQIILYSSPSFYPNGEEFLARQTWYIHNCLIRSRLLVQFMVSLRLCSFDYIATTIRVNFPFANCFPP